MYKEVEGRILWVLSSNWLGLGDIQDPPMTSNLKPGKGFRVNAKQQLTA